MVQISVPFTALTMVSVYFALRNKTAFYLFAASCLVLFKEPAIFTISIITLYKYLEKDKRWFLYLLPASLFFSGISALVCEVAWTRAFAQIIGSSAYAFTIMLSVYLFAIAAGSLFFGFLCRRFTPSASWGWILPAGASLVLVFTLPLYNYLPYFYIKLFPHTLKSRTALHLAEFLLCGSIMFIPAFFSGIILPYFISASNAWAGRIHKTTGLFYGTNTLGCVFGAVLAGLMLIPHFGTEVSLIWGGIFFAASALCALITVPNGPVPQKPSHPETSPSSFSLSATTALADPPWRFGGQPSACLPSS